MGTGPAVCVAFASSSVYFVGIAFFKVAAVRMPVLYGHRPVRLAAEMLTSPVWLAGAVVMAVGMVLQGIALSALTLPTAQPVFVSALCVLLVIAIGCFAERLSGREWLSVTLIVAATAMIAAAGAGLGPAHDSAPPASLLAVVVLPCLLVPVAVFLVCDLTPVGVHARPSAGVVLGVTAGALIGTAELALDGMTGPQPSAGPLPGGPYPYLFLIAAGLGVAQLQTALQRHRLVIVVLVATVVAKTHLLLSGTVLYGLVWPRGSRLPLLMAGGVALAWTAIAMLPRHEHRAAPVQDGDRRRPGRRDRIIGGALIRSPNRE